MKAVMYHYVREFDDDHPNFRFLDVENFKKQLDFFSKEYGFVSKDDWNDFVAGHGINKSKGKIILTLDDAMSCHYDYVFPELIKRDLWGVFYVPTLPYSEGKLLDVHRIHLLCGAINGRDLLNSLLSFITDEMIPDKKREEFRLKTYMKQDNYDGVTEFKRILNYFIGYECRETVIDKVAKTFGYDFDVSKFYITPENLKKMKQGGMVIGSHTINHPVMSKLSREEQSIEINDSFNYLEKMGCLTTKTYCHPYGGFHSFNKNTVDLLNDLNVLYSFNVESRDITEEDISDSRQFLPRFDSNEFPHGTVS